jgi:hypothetical protein
MRISRLFAGLSGMTPLTFSLRLVAAMVIVGVLCVWRHYVHFGVIGDVWFYVFALAPFLVIIPAAMNRRYAGFATVSGVLYVTLYQAANVYVTFVSRSGVDAVALLVIPIVGLIVVAMAWLLKAIRTSYRDRTRR